VVPGCRHYKYVDVHHLQPRWEGGLDVAENLVVLCGAHHRALHRGQLRAEGSVATGLRFRHFDGTEYGFEPRAALVDLGAECLRALRNLGFAEKTARGAVERALDAAPAHVLREDLLRACLSIACPDSSRARV
jgi:hypothetical protein